MLVTHDTTEQCTYRKIGCGEKVGKRAPWGIPSAQSSEITNVPPASMALESPVNHSARLGRKIGGHGGWRQLY